MADKSKEKPVAMADKVAVETEQTSKTSVSKGEYRDGNMEYMKGMYPDTEINDDNYSSMMEETLGKQIPKMKNYDKTNKSLRAMMDSEPTLSKILGDMAKGGKFEEVLPRYLDTRNLELKPGDPDYTVWEANNKHREDAYEQKMNREKEIMSNEQESQRIISQWFKDNKYDDAAQKEYRQNVAKSMEGPYDGKISKEFLDGEKRRINYESDMAKETKAAEIKGKNTTIVEQKMKEEKVKTGDGLPVIDGGASKTKETPKETGNALERGLRNRGNKKSVIPNNY